MPHCAIGKRSIESGWTEVPSIHCKTLGIECVDSLNGAERKVSCLVLYVQSCQERESRSQRNAAITPYSRHNNNNRTLFSCLSANPLLLTLEVVQQHTSLLALLTPVPNNNAAAVDDLSCITLSIQHAETSPFAEHLAIRDLDQRDLVLGAQGNDKFLVCFFLAGFVEDAHVGLATIEGFACFTETSC